MMALLNIVKPPKIYPLIISQKPKLQHEFLIIFRTCSIEKLIQKDLFIIKKKILKKVFFKSNVPLKTYTRKKR